MCSEFADELNIGRCGTTLRLRLCLEYHMLICKDYVQGVYNQGKSGKHMRGFKKSQRESRKIRELSIA